MSDDKPPASFLIGAQIRIAAREGIPMVIRRRGDESIGAIILKINRLDGTAHILTQVRMDDELMWSPVSRTDPMPEADAERYLEKQAKIDPDSWLVEIEDRQGRHWFPGRIVKF
ncbi:MAG: DUF1491 family protein [Bdellovibrionales bacterium]